MGIRHRYREVDGVREKQCTRCFLFDAEASFAQIRTLKGTPVLDSWCRKCRAHYQQARREKAPREKDRFENCVQAMKMLASCLRLTMFTGGDGAQG